MKKQLLSVSALVAVGMLLAPATVHAAAKKTPSPTITIGGYTVQGMRHSDSLDGNVSGAADTGGLREFGDSEIYFNIKAQLDNGIKITGTWQLEGSGNGTTGIDEHHITLSGDFGSVKLGQGDNVGQMMINTIGSFATQVGLTLSFDRAELIPSPSGYSSIGNIQLDQGNNDAPKISYRTPRVGGLQLGVSYGRDISTNNSDAGVNSTAESGVEDMRVVAANFTQKFGNANFTIAGGYLSQKQGGAAAQGSTNDPSQWSIGAKVASGPFVLAVAHTSLNDVGNTTTSGDGEAWDMGIRYTMGAHKVGAAWFTEQTEGVVATAGDDKGDVIWLTHSMAVGPGLTWGNTLAFGDFQGEGAAAGKDNDGMGFATHIKVSF